MKKHIFSIAFIGLFIQINAQNTQVGINTTSPKATLDIAAKTDGSTKPEGILIPKLTGEQIKAMAVSADQNTMMVYATEAANPAIGIAANITEPGYYYYQHDAATPANSIWIKIITNKNNEWLYDGATKNINLVRSGQATDFTNKIYFDGIGRLFNYDNTPISRIGWSYSPSLNVAADQGNSFNVNILDAKKIPKRHLNSNGYHFIKTEDYLVIGNEALAAIPTPSQRLFLNNQSEVYINQDITEPFYGAVAVSGGVRDQSNTKSEQLTGGLFTASTQSSEANRIFGLAGQAYVSGSSSVQDLRSLYGVNVFGNYNLTQIPEVQNSSSIYALSAFRGNAFVNNLNIVNAQLNFDVTAINSQIGKVKGFNYATSIPDGFTGTIGEHYGIYLNNINKATNNWAIYTNAGKNSFGDQVEIRTINANTSTNDADKVVVADATTGELKTKDAASLPGAEWIYNSATNRINLKRSGTAPFLNTVYYDNATGKFVNKTNTAYNEFDNDLNTFVTNNISESGKGSFFENSSKNIAALSYQRGAETYTSKVLSENSLYMNDETATNNLHIYTSRNNLVTAPSNLSDVRFLMATSNNINKSDPKTATYMAGANNSISINDGNVTEYATATRSEVYLNSPGTINNASSVINFSTVGPRLMTTSNLSGVSAGVNYLGNATGGIENATAYNAVHTVHKAVNPFLTNVFGYRYLGISSEDVLTHIQNHYGFYLNDINKATNNWAIYTNAGKNSFGDQVEIRTINANTSTNATDKVVVADANGVLKTKDASALNTNTWSLIGNAGTTAGTNFIGTTDDIDLVFKRETVPSGIINKSLFNTSFGYNTLSENTSTNIYTGRSNTAIGFEALRENVSGALNVGLGSQALAANTTGFSNVALGAYALAKKTTGDYNIAIGSGNPAQLNYAALGNLIDGTGNISIGSYNMTATSSATGNTSMGFVTLNRLATGSFNTAIGNKAGEYLTSGTYNLFLGTETYPNISVSGNNQMNIGNSIFGYNNKVGIGTAYKATYDDSGNITTAGLTPTEQLEVDGSIKLLKINSTAYNSFTATDKVVVADANGVLKTKDASAIASEPWYNVNGNVPATANNQNIYQIGNVGIRTTTPAVALDVFGNVRVQSMPQKGNTFTYNGSSTIYSPAKTVIADNNGVLGTMPYLPELVWMGTGLGWKLLNGNDTASPISYGLDLSYKSPGYPGTWGAIGGGSIALGGYPVASGIGSVAINNNTSSGISSMTWGGGKTNTVPSGISEGQNTASNNASTAFGISNNANGVVSTAFGIRNTASDFGETAFGTYGTTYTPVTNNETSATSDSDRLLNIGNGTGTDFSFVRSDAFTILKNAKVGIDIDNFETTASDSKLQVNGGIQIKSETATLDAANCNSNTRGKIIFVNDNFYGCKSTGWVQLNN